MPILPLPTPPIAVATLGISAVAYFTSSAMQRVVRRLAIKFGFLDHPDKLRRTHAHAVPRLGGIGVFTGLVVASVLGASLDSAGHVITLIPLVLAMAAGAAILFLAGLADDIVGVPPLGKVIVQSMAALIVYQFGFRIENIVLPTGGTFALGLASLPVTIFWIVGLSNAFNLIDGADGLAAGIATIVLLATAASAAVLHDQTIVWCSFALIGALLGFLRFNWPPARIFLGDSGSLVVGFLLAVLTVKGMSRADGAVYGLAPVFALCYPLLDTGIAMLRRWLRGEPLSRADGRHIHHQLQALGLGPRQTLMVLYGLSALIAALGLSATFAPPHLTITVAVAGAAVLVLILVYGTQWLQYHELIEAGSSLASAVLTGRSRMQDNIHARDIVRLIDQVNTTQELSAMIEENAETFRFAHMQLRRGMSRQTPPQARLSDVSPSRLWALDYPIVTRSGLGDPFYLSVWCSTDSQKAASAERIVRILAPALERWMLRCREQISTSSFLDSFPESRGDVRDTPADVVSLAEHGRNRGRRRVSSPETRPDV